MLELMLWIAFALLCIATGFLLGAISAALAVGLHRDLPDTED